MPSLMATLAPTVTPTYNNTAPPTTAAPSSNYTEAPSIHFTQLTSSPVENNDDMDMDDGGNVTMAPTAIPTSMPTGPPATISPTIDPGTNVAPLVRSKLTLTLDGVDSVNRTALGETLEIYLARNLQQLFGNLLIVNMTSVDTPGRLRWLQQETKPQQQQQTIVTATYSGVALFFGMVPNLDTLHSRQTSLMGDTPAMEEAIQANPYLGNAIQLESVAFEYEEMATRAPLSSGARRLCLHLCCILCALSFSLSCYLLSS